MTKEQLKACRDVRAPNAYLDAPSRALCTFDAVAAAATGEQNG